MNDKMVRRMYSFSPEAQDMLEEIKRKSGMATYSSAIVYAISIAHKGMFPSYAQSKRGESKDEREDRKAREAEEAQMEIVKKLGGRIEEKGGHKVVAYYTYHLRKRYEQKRSINMIDESTVKQQYNPSREAVMRLKEAGKTDW